jgi:TPP-dependent 2-oxoacid decarboxylase
MVMTQLEKLTAILGDGSWHSTQELVQSVGHRFSATIYTAVNQYGYKIEKRRIERQGFEYRLIR